MRTLSKDILMVCKYLYNKENCRNIQHALKRYIEAYTWCEPDVKTINHFLGHAVKKFIDVTTLVNALKEHSESFWHKTEDPQLFLLNTYISLLQMKTVEDIDLSDYHVIQEYVKNKSNNKDWWDQFVDSVEDDRD